MLKGSRWSILVWKISRGDALFGHAELGVFEAVAVDIERCIVFEIDDARFSGVTSVGPNRRVSCFLAPKSSCPTANGISPASRAVSSICFFAAVPKMSRCCGKLGDYKLIAC